MIQITKHTDNLSEYMFVVQFLKDHLIKLREAADSSDDTMWSLWVTSFTPSLHSQAVEMEAKKTHKVTQLFWLQEYQTPAALLVAFPDWYKKRTAINIVWKQ